MTAAGAVALAARWGFPQLGLVVALAAGAMDIITGVVCTADPPADPGLTQQDVFDALNVTNPLVSVPASIKVQQWFVRRYWFEVCHCSTVATPPPPVMSNPNTPVGNSTGAPSATNSPPCWSAYGAIAITSPNCFAVGIVDPWLPAGPGSLVTSPGVCVPHVCLPPPGTVSVSWSLQHESSTVPMQITLQQISSTFTDGPPLAVMGDSSVAGVQTGSHAVNLIAAEPYLVIYAESNPLNSGNWQTRWAGTVSFGCSGMPPNGLVQPCCPPDPLLDAKLDQIYGLVLNLYNRGAARGGGYTRSTIHPGLTGSGNISANALVGVLVDVTAQPPTTVLPGNPAYVFDLGWLSCSTPDGFIDQKRLTREHQVWLPPLMPISNTFGFFLNPGVTATVTELLPA